MPHPHLAPIVRGNQKRLSKRASIRLATRLYSLQLHFEWAVFAVIDNQTDFNDFAGVENGIWNGSSPDRTFQGIEHELTVTPFASFAPVIGARKAMRRP